MRITIIGSNGLLSDSLGEYCDQNNIHLDVCGLAKPLFYKYDNFYYIDLTKDELDYKNIIEADMIIYAAGAGIQSYLNESIDLIYELNTSVPIRIINNLKKYGYKGTLVTFGSYFEIGETSENKYYTEIDVLNSSSRVPNDYSISKRLLSRFISCVEVPFKTWHFILPTIYGEKESSQRLISYTINAIKNNFELQFTSGDQVRQYIYIEEVVNIVISAYKNDITGGVYNVSGTETLTVKQLVELLFNLFEKTLPESVFGKAKRLDTGMKVLKLNGNKLLKNIDYRPSLKISDVYERY